MTTVVRLSRFYGMTIASEVGGVRTEGLCDLNGDDLFEAHLSRNFGYFGALDKTLSGFVLLNNDGDDAWLLDARDTGAVYFQSHEEREFMPRFASLSDWRAWMEASNNNDGDAEDAGGSIDESPPSKRVISTAALGHRLQWAVWFFAQPMKDNRTDSDNRSTNKGIGWFTEHFGNDPNSLYLAERSSLADDVHLACSWLLVAAALADRTFAEDIIRIGPQDNELFDAFARAIGGLSPQDTLPVLPLFASRKASLLMSIAMVWDDPRRVDRLAHAIWVAPQDDSVERANLLVVLAEQHDRVAAAVQLAAQLGDQPSGVALRGFLAGHAALRSEITGAADTHDAIAAFELAMDPHCAEFKVRAPLMFAAFAALGDDHDRKWQGANALLQVDPYHFSSLEVAAKAAQQLGLAQAAEFAKLHCQLGAIRTIYQRCSTNAEPAEMDQAITEAQSLVDEERALLVTRVLAAPDSFHAKLKMDCLQWSVHHPSPERAEQWWRALSSLGYGSGEPAVKSLRQAMPVPNGDVEADILAVLKRPLEMKGPEILRDSAQRDICKQLNAWLSAIGGPDAIEKIVRRLESSDPISQTCIIDSALNASDPGYVLMQMTDAQALRAVNVLLSIQRTGSSNKRLFGAAGTQLARLSHSAAEPRLVDALSMETGKEMVANLYGALIRINSPRCQQALVSRLHDEQRWFWRMADAVASVWCDTVEAMVLHAVATSEQGIVVANRAG